MEHRELATEYSSGFVLAPMAGITDSAMRRICRGLGATATVTEMVSAAGLSRRSVKTSRLLVHTEEERPLGVQLFGCKPEDFFRAAGLLDELGFDFVDINAGCPVRRVASKGSGAGLLRDLPRLLRIVEATRSSTRLPVTVKIRLGWSPDIPLDPAAPRLLAEAGASAIAVHGRHRCDQFAGDVDCAGIARIVSSSPVPVLANGDSSSSSAVRSLLRSTGASGALLGRGAVSNPWIFRGLRGGGPARAMPGELREIVNLQLRMMHGYIDAPYVYHAMRGHLCRYLRGFPEASSVRERAVHVETDADVDAVLAMAEERIHGGRPE